MRCIVLGVVGLIATGGLAQAYPGSTVTFEGAVIVTAVTSGCNDLGIEVGNKATLVFRHKVAASDLADAIDIISDRAMFNMISTQASGSLSGSSPVAMTAINKKAVVLTSTSSANLVITPFGSQPLESTNNARLTGTINGYFAYAPCNIGIRSALTVSP